MRRPIAVFESEVSRWLNVGGTVESLCGNRRYRSGVLVPRFVGDVQRIVCAALRAEGAVKLQPVSCGKNWGFGSDLATVDGVYTLNLSGLKSIRSLDLRSHSVELEPGVTQGQLDDALRREGSTHYFNVTGAGLGASVLGNALERGIGYSGQRHLDLLDLEVVLPSGEMARTSRLEAAGGGVSLGGLGPDPTGLFCQSNFGVVTAATIALSRRPEVMGGILCRLDDHRRFPDLIAIISDLIADGSCYGVPHIFNRERIVTTLCPHLGEAQAAELRAKTACWTALIPLRGSRAVFDASTRHLEAQLKHLGPIEILDDQAKVKLSSLVLGHPSDLTLASVAFSAFGHYEPTNAALEASGAGLLHITPVMALRGDTIRDVEKQTMETLGRHGYRAVPLSLNALSARTAALIVSLGFDRRCPDRTRAAHHAAEDLLRSYGRAGLIPYRLGLGQADQLPKMQPPWQRIFSGLRRILDPSGCMAPSRYEPLWRKGEPVTTHKIEEAEPCIS
jgi:4-cresol dehydrogenase (hydroxylating)